MIKNSYEIENLKNKLVRRRERAELLLPYYNHIEIVKNKDGSQKKNINQAIISNNKGLKVYISKARYPLWNGAVELVLVPLTPEGYSFIPYGEDNFERIDLYSYARNDSNEHENARAVCLNKWDSQKVDYYQFNDEMIEKAIADKKEYLRNEAERITNELESLDNLCAEIDDKIGELKAIVSKSKEHSRLYEIIKKELY